jgi:hypothetical protein
LGPAVEVAEVGAEAEALDTDLERNTAAMKQVREERFKAEGTPDVVFDFGDFAGSESFPARADGSVVAETVEEELDLAEGEAHVGGEADQQNAMECGAGIAALATDALRRGEEAHFFVVTDGGGVEAGVTGEFTDFHVSSLVCSQEGAARRGERPDKE